MMRKTTAEKIVGGIGWLKPDGCRLTHYFASDERSSCGAVQLYGALSDGVQGEHHIGGGPNDCAACSKKVVEALDVLD